jgi:hypothetical protein
MVDSEKIIGVNGKNGEEYYIAQNVCYALCAN